MYKQFSVTLYFDGQEKSRLKALKGMYTAIKISSLETNRS